MSHGLSLPLSFYKKSGPREYLIVQITPDIDNQGKFRLTTPNEDLFERCWRQVVDHSFPRAPVVQDSTFLRSVVDLGEHLALQQHLHTDIDPTIWILAVPRTFYELTALTIHAFDRATTRFGVFDPSESEGSILEPFYFDHKSTVKKITPELLLQRTEGALSKKSLLKIARNLNWVLVCLLRRVSLSDASAGIRSVLDLDLECDSVEGSITQLAAWMMNVAGLDFAAVADVLLDDLSSIERGHSSSISSSYDFWPLSSPFVEAVLDDPFEEGSQVRETFVALEADLARLQASIMQLNDASLSKSNDILAEMRKKSVDSQSGAYGTLANIFCPEVLQAETLPSRFSDLKRFTSQLDIVRRADPFISAIRQAGFFAPRQLVKRVLAQETLERTSDFAFLFRGSVDLKHESMTTLEHTLSPAQYGLELGSSTDYTNIDSNPCRSHSMSFGYSLFAGLLYDPTASVWTYWSSPKTSSGYIVQLPLEERLLTRLAADLRPSSTEDPVIKTGASEPLQQICSKDGDSTANVPGEHYTDWFFLPPLPTLVALAGSGELWHPRSKCGIPSSHREDSFHFISGMLNCSYRRVPEFLLIADKHPPLFNSLPIFHIKQ